jgi:hypothetical protein
MNKLSAYLILLFLCFSGCLSSRMTKGYDFTGAQLIVDQKDVVINAALLGTSSPAEKKGGLNVTIRSNPYTLFFVLRSNTGYYRETIISNVILRNEKNEFILSKSPPPGVGQFSESPGGSIAKVAFKPLELPYERLFLSADVEIMTRANSVIKQPIQFSFEPTYSEGKSND